MLAEFDKTIEDPIIVASLGAIKDGINLNQNAEVILPHFELAIKHIGTYYDAKKYLQTIDFLHNFIQTGLPLLSIIPANHASDHSYITDPEMAIMYTMCYAANDAARIYLSLADDPANAKDAKDFRNKASTLLLEQVEWGTKFREDIVVLKALGNEKKIVQEQLLREFYFESYNDKIKRAQIAKESFSQIKIMTGVAKYAKDISNDGFRKDTSNITCFSITAENKIRYPEGSYDISLKYVANFLNHLAAFRSQYTEMIVDDDPIEANQQLILAEAELKDASSYYLRFLKGKVSIPEELHKRSLAIHSNLAYVHTLNFYINPALDEVTLSEMELSETTIHEHFIKSSFNSFKLCSPETQDELRIEALARSALIVGISMLARTHTSPTLNFETGYYSIEHSVIDGILAFLKNPTISAEFNYYGRSIPFLKKLGISLLNKAVEEVIDQTNNGKAPNTENKIALLQAVIKFKNNGWISEPQPNLQKLFPFLDNFI